MMIMLYVGGLVCVSVFRDDTDNYYPAIKAMHDTDIVSEFDPQIYFGTVPKAMYTLFNLVVFAEFSEFARPIFLKQPHFWVIFPIIIFISSFGLLNMLVGIVVENTMKTSE